MKNTQRNLTQRFFSAPPLAPLQNSLCLHFSYISKRKHSLNTKNFGGWSPLEEVNSGSVFFGLECWAWASINKMVLRLTLSDCLDAKVDTMPTQTISGNLALQFWWPPLPLKDSGIWTCRASTLSMQRSRLPPPCCSLLPKTPTTAKPLFLQCFPQQPEDVWETEVRQKQQHTQRACYFCARSTVLKHISGNCSGSLCSLKSTRCLES